MVYHDQFKTGLTPREVYRVNRIRFAEHFNISPTDVDQWDTQTYYDVLEVRAADEMLKKLNS